MATLSCLLPVAVLLSFVAARPELLHREKRQAQSPDQTSYMYLNSHAHQSEHVDSLTKFPAVSDANTGSLRYPNSAHWVMVVSNTAQTYNYYINIQYDIDIESHPSCVWDKLTFGENKADPVVICGSQKGEFSVLLSGYGTQYRISFMSDNVVNRRGFILNVSLSNWPDYDTDARPQYTQPPKLPDFYDYSSNYSSDYYPSYSSAYYPSYSSDYYPNYSSAYYPSYSSDYYPSYSSDYYPGYSSAYYPGYSSDYYPGSTYYGPSSSYDYYWPGYNYGYSSSYDYSTPAFYSYDSSNYYGYSSSYDYTNSYYDGQSSAVWGFPGTMPAYNSDSGGISTGEERAALLQSLKTELRELADAVKEAQQSLADLEDNYHNDNNQVYQGPLF